jgi:hypothetical protein
MASVSSVTAATTKKIQTKGQTKCHRLKIMVTLMTGLTKKKIGALWIVLYSVQ